MLSSWKRSLQVYEIADDVAHRENCKYPTVHSREPLLEDADLSQLHFVKW